VSCYVGQPGLTVAKLNAELKRRGILERLRRGRGYHYFVEGRAHAWYTSSVYVYRVDSLSVDEWIAERDLLANDFRNL
jgi:hypothetical protein